MKELWLYVLNCFDKFFGVKCIIEIFK